MSERIMSRPAPGCIRTMNLALRNGAQRVELAAMANLLLIDDDPDLLRDRVSHVFPAPAHRVEVARSGAEGLDRVAAACPDVILLDLRLPDQSGLDVLKQLRQIDARIPVVMVTVARSSDSGIEAMRFATHCPFGAEWEAACHLITLG